MKRICVCVRCHEQFVHGVSKVCSQPRSKLAMLCTPETEGEGMTRRLAHAMRPGQPSYSRKTLRKR
jgi:hypothetical protein